jgi:hypothetical protein
MARRKKIAGTCVVCDRRVYNMGRGLEELLVGAGRILLDFGFGSCHDTYRIDGVVHDHCAEKLANRWCAHDTWNLTSPMIHEDTCLPWTASDRLKTKK